MQDAGNVPRPEETRLARRGHRVKFHFKSQQGIANWTNDEAAKVVARDRESAQRDLFENIEQRNFPRWNLRVQVMPEADAARYHINPLDVTKVWPHKDYPLIDVGVLELNRNPDNYFAEVEQVAMNPANIVPGIGFSPDKMLQGRLFSYGDAPARETVFGRCMGRSPIAGRISCTNVPPRWCSGTA